MIYFIQQGEKGPIKIGTSSFPQDRLKNLQTANPENLVLLGFFEGSVSTEQRLHNKFKNLRMQGEWFKFDTKILQEIREKEEEREEEREEEKEEEREEKREEEKEEEKEDFYTPRDLVFPSKKLRLLGEKRVPFMVKYRTLKAKEIRVATAERCNCSLEDIDWGQCFETASKNYLAN